jgi:hypothetical protein
VIVVQVHPTKTRSKHLGIQPDILSDVTDGDGPLPFWMNGCPLKKNLFMMLREVALRVLPGKASALGVERLWSGAKLTFVDNRRSFLTPRLMQLLKLKMNMGLLTETDAHLLEALGIQQHLAEDELFDSIFQDLEEFEQEETWVPGVVVADRNPTNEKEDHNGEEVEDSDSDDDPFHSTAFDE